MHVFARFYALKRPTEVLIPRRQVLVPQALVLVSVLPHPQHVTDSPGALGQAYGPDEGPAFAALLKTSRTQVDRLLDPKNDITLCAAAMVGRRVSIKLI